MRICQVGLELGFWLMGKLGHAWVGGWHLAWVHGGGGGATENIPTIPNHLPSGSSATLHLMLSFQFSKKQKRTTKNTSGSIYKSSSINKFIY